MGRSSFLILLLALSACAPKHIVPSRPASKSKPAPHQEKITVPVPMGDPTWSKRWWIERTARFLRAGQGIGPGDRIEELLIMNEDRVIEEFMKDSRFADAVLDFNMYFMGFKADALRQADGSYTAAAFELANAIHSARATVKGGDFLSLFDFESGLFVPPLRTEIEDDEKGPLPEVRKKIFARLQKRMRDLVRKGENPKVKPADFCRDVEAFNRDLEQTTEDFTGPFDRVEVVLERGEALPDGIETTGCDKPDRQTVENLAGELEDQLEQYERAFGEIFKFEAARYRPRSLDQFRQFDVSRVANEYSGSWISFSNEMNMALMNSSTNSNRKRAAYVLKNFFCDDLTPVGFESPAQHTGGPHGSQTTCYACHYKLDPMAGFFRFFGGQFADYTKQTEILFDDGVSMNRAEYDRQWRNGAGGAREWNVGYIRSPDPRFQSRNDYGETLADLSRILRRAPEVRRCLVRRAFAYAVGDNQVLDGRYVEELVRQFEAETAASSSGTAFKNLLARIAKSRLFSEPNPIPDVCYDHGAGDTGAGGPPCRVASILQTYCQNCHSSTQGPGGLDLSGWILAPDGVHSTFPHLDPAGRQKDHKETFAAIADRLSTNDPKRRMPKGIMMPSQDRQQLYLWSQEQM